MGPTYGFFLHGCIDGSVIKFFLMSITNNINSFSRKILWLHLTPTNHNPHVVAKFYAEYVKEIGGNNYDSTWIIYNYSLIFIGCPQMVRSDRGTENCILATCQMALRHYHGDTFSGEKSFRYGKSTRNTVNNNF